MTFEDLSFWDRQEIQNSLGTALGARAIASKEGRARFTKAPMERAEADASFVYNSGWAIKDDQGHWEIDLEAYLDHLAKTD